MARSFNGTTDRIDYTLALTLGVTLAAWIKTTTASAAACILDNDTGAAGGRAYQFRVASGKLQAIFFSGGSAFTATGATTINDGKWHHVAVTCPTSGVFTLYVAGVSDGTSASHGWDHPAGATGGSIGSHHQGASQFFAGSIADAVIFGGTTLSARQLGSLAAGVPASHLGVSNYLPLWGADSPEPDIGNGPATSHANGTLHGTSTATGPPVGSGLLVIA